METLKTQTRNQIKAQVLQEVAGIKFKALLGHNRGSDQV